MLIEDLPGEGQRLRIFSDVERESRLFFPLVLIARSLPE
jgi:hypothetical protein